VLVVGIDKEGREEFIDGKGNGTMKVAAAVFDMLVVLTLLLSCLASPSLALSNHSLPPSPPSKKPSGTSSVGK
jgi:hypothetical protein